MHQVTGEHPCRKVISVKFLEVEFWHASSPVNLLHISERLFIRTLMESCFWSLNSITSNILSKALYHISARTFEQNLYRTFLISEMLIVTTTTTAKTKAEDIL